MVRQPSVGATSSRSQVSDGICSVYTTFVRTIVARNSIGATFFVRVPVRNGKAVDAQVVANARYDQMCPPAVHHCGKHKVPAQVPQFRVCRYGAECSTRKSEVRVIDQQCAANHWCKHDGPVREWLACQMRKDDLGRHTSKDKGHSETVEYEVVVLQDERVRRAEPC